MKVTLTPAWELSDEHARSQAGQPVLVNRGTGAAYGPEDPVDWKRHIGSNQVSAARG